MKPSLISLNCCAFVYCFSLAAPAAEKVELAAETAIVGLDERTKVQKDLEEMWMSGKQTDYFAVADMFFSRFARFASNNQMSIHEFSGEVATMMAKTKYANDESYQRAIVSKVHVLSEYGLLLRSRKDLLFSGAFDEFLKCADLVLTDIDKKYVRGFVLHAVELAVPLHDNVPGFVGMDPKFITDPVARAAYQKAIDQNRAFSQENGMQEMLDAQRKTLRQQIEATGSTAKTTDPNFSSENLIFYYGKCVKETKA